MARPRRADDLRDSSPARGTTLREPAAPKHTPTRVLDAALAVYETEGHAGFNVHAIVAQSGVSLGSLYHHFGSMDGLCAALYARSMAQLLDQIHDSLARVRSLRRGVSAIVAAYLQFAHRKRSAMLFIHASAYAGFLPAHATTIADSKGPRIERIRAFFAKHTAAGEVVVLPVELLEVLVLGPIAELTRRWLAGDESLDLERAARLLPARILASIALPPHDAR